MGSLWSKFFERMNGKVINCQYNVRVISKKCFYVVGHGWGWISERNSCTRFSTLGFFHQSTPPVALIQGLKPFCIWLRIRQENRLYSNFSDVIYTAETLSMVSLTPLKRFQQVQWHRWNGFSDEMISVWEVLQEKNMILCYHDVMITLSW
jgi:hypothetical protein